MNALAAGSWKAAKLALIAVVVAVAALGLVRDGRPAAAAGAGQIVISKSNTSPIPAGSLVLMTGGQPLEVYIWIKDLNVSTGASAFQVDLTYGGDVVHASIIYPYTVWLASTGRSVACLGAGIDNEAGEAFVSCNTLQIPPPYGANGTGLLARLKVVPQDQVALTTLDFQDETFLVDTPPNPDDIQEVFVKPPAITVQVAPCADFNGDNTVRVADILYVVQQYFTADPGADLNDDGIVNVSDILIAVQEYFQDCPA